MTTACLTWIACRKAVQLVQRDACLAGKAACNVDQHDHITFGDPAAAVGFRQTDKIIRAVCTRHAVPTAPACQMVIPAPKPVLNRKPVITSRA